MTNTAPHAIERAMGRLNGLVTEKEIRFAQHVATIVTPGKYYLELAKMGKVVHLPGADNVNGDALVAVIRNNTVVTFMLAKSWKLHTYFTDGQYIIQ